MHRSGTSILTKVLEKGGIFMGVHQDHNHEAVHFLSLNQQTLKASNADWLNPLVPEQKNWKTLPPGQLFTIHFKINSRIQRILYTLRSPKWGFKDPRTTFTLPMWLTIFPKTKVIHLIRNQEAVALSLKKRNSVLGEVHDENLENLDFNRSLWEKYVTQGRSYTEQLGDRYLEIEYEKLLEFDSSTISALEKFTSCKLESHFKKHLR